ncbi:Protein CPR-5 [Apostasia shenzhenica]|uniref:Protein CPR-5 n=1 Tax=Apostasia shenzhenica TaxID=1088818 RepID=A0A2I0AKM6_9ASPA|nr:Protein CPR-5 [Apostasia shenzhenica]
MQICSLAVKESVSNIHGNRFDCFLRNFEKSFDSTLKTLQMINEISNSIQGDKLREEQHTNIDRGDLVHQQFFVEPGTCSSLASTTCGIESTCRGEHVQEFQTLSSESGQLALQGEFNQQIVCASQGRIMPTCSNESIRTTFEKSVKEQTRSNDLKAIEISLVMRKLQLKQSQLAMNSYANFLEKVKLCMNMSKAAFREEKLRNQIQDTRHAELIKRCIDLLVSGLIIMCAILIYGASIFSYQRLTEITSSCSNIYKESKSWWMPKPLSSVSSGWLMLKCHVVVMTRMLFGLLMILVIAYSLFQRSVVSGTAMPVTFILLLLGIACGTAGKLCVDSLGGNGYQWLIYWEILCLIHLFANIFPSILYSALHGHVSVTQKEKARGVPFWMRRYIFYSLLLLILPTMAGLLAFASVMEWKEHFTEKITLLISRAEHEG